MIRYWQINIFVLLFFIFPSFLLLSAGNNGNGLFPSNRNKSLYEINDIKFVGNSNFDGSELEAILSSRISRRNTVHKFVEFYYSSLGRIKNINRYLPPGGMATLRKTLTRWAPEIQYFEEPRAQSDLETIKDFYNQSGFHDASASFTFLPDSGSKSNVLSFFISEGSRYNVQIVVYKGFDSINGEIKNIVFGAQNIKLNKPFSEEDVVKQVNSMQQTLLNNGYYYSSFMTPVITKDTTHKLDSLTIEFFTGKRQKISSIMFVDSLGDQKIVTNSMKSQQLTFSTGNWYSRKEIEESRQNLQALGTFELVSIDTSSSAGRMTDTSIALQVLTRYRKQQDFGMGFYLNRTLNPELLNGGFEISYLNRNSWGSAQSLNAFTRLEIRDLLNRNDPEWQLGLNHTQPFLWKIGNARVGAAGQFLYSISNIETELVLRTASLQLKFPVKQPPWTYFNNMSFDFLIEWQVPSNLDTAKKIALRSAETDFERDRVEENFKVYSALNRHYKDKPGVFQQLTSPTAFIIGFSMIGDSRDELFNPTKGYFTNVSLDFWPGIIGIAKYIRPQISYNLFTSLNQYTVFALKARGGYIYWDTTNSYVPFERQFFAGGANSVRGWGSRKLRYYTGEIRTSTGTQDMSFAEDFVGSRVILEGTFELRWRFGRPRWVSETVADIINMGVMTGFLDWGNTFHWMAFNGEDYYKDFGFTKYLNLAVSLGVGFGIQLPVGPLRVDFAMPIYDPSPEDGLKMFVPNRKNSLWEYKQIHLGLGYAF